MRTFPVSLCIVLLFVAGCKTTRYSANSITLGKGGGFTGKYEIFTIRGDGGIYFMDAASANSSPVSLIKKLSRKETADVFRKASAMNIPEPEFNYPGNLTSYIEYFDGNTTRSIKWGDPKHQPPDNIKTFFDETWTKLKNY